MAHVGQCVQQPPGHLSCSDLERAQNKCSTHRDCARTVSECLLLRYGSEVVCCTQSPSGRPLLTRTSTGDTQAQIWLSLCGLGMHFVPFPGLSSSEDQMFGEHTVPSVPCILITSPDPPTYFPGRAEYLLWIADLRL